MNQRIKMLEEELSWTKEKCQNSEKKICKVENEAAAIVNDFRLVKDEAERLKQEIYIRHEENKGEKIKLEDRTRTAEEELERAKKTIENFEYELLKIAGRAEKEHCNAMERIRAAEAELVCFQKKAKEEFIVALEKIKTTESQLKCFQDKAQMAEKKLSNAHISFKHQKEDLIKRAVCAEDMLASVKNTVGVAEEKIKKFEHRFEVVEEDLSKVKEEAEERIKELEIKLKNSIEKERAIRAELSAMDKSCKLAEVKLQKAYYRAKKVEKATNETSSNRSVEKKSCENSPELANTKSTREIKQKSGVSQAVSSLETASIFFPGEIEKDSHNLKRLESILNCSVENAKAHFKVHHNCTTPRNKNDSVRHAYYIKCLLTF